jgi:hypothetical protein
MTIPAGPTTPEGAALTLLQIIASCENKTFDGYDGEKIDRAWILDTFTECLKAARYER